jgi:hypothetical protein
MAKYKTRGGIVLLLPLISEVRTQCAEIGDVLYLQGVVSRGGVCGAVSYAIDRFLQNRQLPSLARTNSEVDEMNISTGMPPLLLVSLTGDCILHLAEKLSHEGKKSNEPYWIVDALREMCQTWLSSAERPDFVQGKPHNTRQPRQALM